MIERIKYKLGDITDWYSGGTPAKGEKDYWNGDIPWISAKTMKKNKVSSSDLNITQKGLKNGSRLAAVGDILLLVRGSGLFLDIPINWVEKTVAFNQDIKAIKAKDVNLQKYLYYWLQGNKKAIGDILEETGIGAGKLDTDLLKKLEVLIPVDKQEQENIAKFCEAIFDKIDVLERQNVILEKLAGAFFRKWFVDDVNPEWDIKPLSSIANFLNGLACQKFPPKNEVDRLPVLKIKELSGGISNNSDWATNDVKPEYIIKNGDVIFAWSASLMVKIWDGKDCVLNQHLFKVTSDKYPKWFYYLWCKNHLADFIIKAASHATTMGHIKKGDLDKAMVIVPSSSDLKEMTKRMEPAINKIIANNTQLATLTSLRDTLLPKLMNGELMIKSS